MYRGTGKVTLKLTVTVNYEHVGDDSAVRYLKRLLDDLPQRAAGEGAFTGDGDETVDTYDWKVEEVGATEDPISDAYGTALVNLIVYDWEHLRSVSEVTDHYVYLSVKGHQALVSRSQEELEEMVWDAYENEIENSAAFQGAAENATAAATHPSKTAEFRAWALGRAKDIPNYVDRCRA